MLLENLTGSDLKGAIYRLSLPTLIECEIYPHLPRAKKEGWKMGELHKEWNDFLTDYQHINIKAPRDHLKTFFFAEAFILQQCFFNAGTKAQLFSKSDTGVFETLNHIKQLARLPYFKSLLVGASIDNAGHIRFSNGSEVFGSSFWSNVRGGHRDIIVLDDVIDSQVVYSDEQNRKSKERLSTEIIPMAEPHTKLLLIGTIQREDDLYSIKFEDDGDNRWVCKTYDAILDEAKELTLFPEKWSWKSLMARKAEITKFSGQQWFDKEYRNMAINSLGLIIKPEWIKYYDRLPSGLAIFTGWDLATGSKLEEGDWTAKITVGVDQQGNIYVIDAYRARIEFGERVRKILDFGASEKPSKIRIEKNTFQNDTVKTAKKNSALPIEGVQTVINKIKKFREQVAPLFENGKVFIKQGDPAQKLFLEELLSLPRGKYDDQVDAFHLATFEIAYLSKASDYAIIV